MCGHWPFPRQVASDCLEARRMQSVQFCVHRCGHTATTAGLSPLAINPATLNRQDRGARRAGHPRLSGAHDTQQML
eukprot:11203064-Alexandrium_andersonii.AAC.1